MTANLFQALEFVAQNLEAQINSGFRSRGQNIISVRQDHKSVEVETISSKYTEFQRRAKLSAKGLSSYGPKRK